MLKEFWQAKRHVVEAAGIVTALGTLFLTIPQPVHNDKARDALASLQFVWLILISISVIVLAWNAFLFAAAVEEKAHSKYGFTITNSVAGAVLALSTWILQAI